MGSLLEAVSSFRGKRIVVTGDTGFKGSWLSLWLHLAGAEVYGYALPAESEKSHFEQLGLKKLIQHQDGDVRDSESLNRFINSSK
ncbi:MAG: CDP-glucose 4,6-dehydratase, partial [Actinomycetota bacterium]